MDEVVATDRQRVAVYGDDPHIEVGARHGDARGNRRRAAVDAVDAVGVHVVREAARAANAGDEHGVLRCHAEFGHQRLHGEQDAVVAAARAPADLLVAGPVLLGREGDGVTHQLTPFALIPTVSAASMAASSSTAVNGKPWTLLIGLASTRYSARTMRASWPRFSSGTITLGNDRSTSPRLAGSGFRCMRCTHAT